MKTRRLAEELSELINPAPTKEFDPEADIFGAGPTLEASDDELQPRSTKRKGKEGRRIVGDIIMEGQEYAGRRTSRSEVYGDHELNGFAPHQGASDDEATDDDDLDAGSDSDEEPVFEQEFETGRSKGRKRKAADDDSDDDDQQSEDDDDERPSQGGRRSAAYDTSEMASLERELAQIQQSEASAAAGLRERAEKERQKALAVKAQWGMWNKALEIRILLQRALQTCNKLPGPKEHRRVTRRSAEVATAYADLASEAGSAMESVLALLGMVTEKHPGMAEAAATVPVYTDKQHEEDSDEEDNTEPLSEKLWRRWDAAYQGFVPFRDASIDRWHRKTVLGAGGGSTRTNMKALNQSVSAQVATLMGDSERLVQRTRLPKRQKTVGSMSQEGDGSEVADQGAADDRDPETYDDSEFYQTLLKEFLDSRSDAVAGNWYTGPKQRKTVDRRASKGRKLRYHVHEKLVNFMAPTELEAPKFASNVFANLFGGAKA